MSGVLHGESGPRDTRPRYDVLQPLTLTDGRFFWLRVGIGYRNPDGTIDAYLDVLVSGHRFRLREPQTADSSKDGRAASEKEPCHGA